MLSNEEDELVLVIQSKEKSDIILYCKYCGSKLEKDQNICGTCGKMVI